MTARGRRKKYFTVAEANATLPLLRSILRDVTDLAFRMRDRHDRLLRLRGDRSEEEPDSYSEELDQIQEAIDQDRQNMVEYEQELADLGIELKDPYTGLVDFPCIMEGREVYLCWQLGEPEVAHWHDLDAGFAGRQKLYQKAGQV